MTFPEAIVWSVAIAAVAFLLHNWWRGEYR